MGYRNQPRPEGNSRLSDWGAWVRAVRAPAIVANTDCRLHQFLDGPKLGQLRRMIRLTHHTLPRRGFRNCAVIWIHALKIRIRVNDIILRGEIPRRHAEVW